MKETAQELLPQNSDPYAGAAKGFVGGGSNDRRFLFNGQPL
ncbi:MAG TPA: hypothetical protein VNH83_00770 [Bryobacteraceae bacterium]|nr:hypothetical protein [Bryobacteraceae bacterium]